MDPYRSPSPMPEDLGLPPPWTVQWDEARQCPYFVNQQTHETSWTHPVDGSSFSPPQDGSRDMSNPYSNGQPYAGGAGSGQAASFYGNQTPQSVQNTMDNPSSGPVQYDANGQPIEGQGGERGLGKVIVGGGLAYMLYKMYKKHSRPQQQYGNQYGGYLGPQQMGSGGFFSRDMNSPQPPPQDSQYSQQSSQWEPPAQVSWAPPSYDPPQPQYNNSSYSGQNDNQMYNNSPYPGSSAQPLQNQVYDAYQNQSAGGGGYQQPSGGSSAWGDPRY